METEDIGHVNLFCKSIKYISTNNFKGTKKYCAVCVRGIIEEVVWQCRVGWGDDEEGGY